MDLLFWLSRTLSYGSNTVCHGWHLSRGHSNVRSSLEHGFKTAHETEPAVLGLGAAEGVGFDSQISILRLAHDLGLLFP